MGEYRLKCPLVPSGFSDKLWERAKENLFVLANFLVTENYVRTTIHIFKLAIGMRRG